VRHEHEGVVLVVELEQGRVRHRRGVDVDGPVGQLLHAIGQLGLALVGRQAAQVDGGQCEFDLHRGRLQRLGVLGTERDAGTQRGLALDDRSQCRLETRDVEHAVQPLRRRQVVERAAGVRRFRAVDACLSGRQRCGLSVGAGHERRPRGGGQQRAGSGGGRRHRVRRRQRAPVDLAVGQRGQRRERDHVLRQHVAGQPLAQVARERAAVERGAGHERQVGHQAHVAGVVFTGHDHAARDARMFVAARFDLAGLDAVAAHLHLEVEPAQVLQQAVVAPSAPVAGAIDRRVGAQDAHGHEALGSERRPVEVAQRHAVATDADLARHADGAGLHLRIEDPHAGVVDGLADRHAARSHCVVLHVPRGRPHGGLGGAVEVPQRGAAFEQRQRQVRAHRLGADPAAQARARVVRLVLFAALPLRLEQQLPHAGRRLQDGDALRLEHRAQALAVHGGFALHQDDLRAGRQRQQHLGHGHVEGQRGHRGDAVVGADAGLALHRLQQVGHGAVRHAHALGLAGGARGVDDVGGVVGARVLAARHQRVGAGLLPRGVAVEFEHTGGGVVAPRARRRAHTRGGQQQAEAGVLRVVVEPGLREARVQRHVGRARLQHRQQRHEHVDAALQAQPHALAAADAALAQRMGQPVGQGIELAVAAAAFAIEHGGGRGARGRMHQEAGVREGFAHQVGARRLQRDQRLGRRGRQHIELADRFARVCRGRARHALEHLEPALHAGFVEQVGVVAGVGQQALRVRAQGQRQVERLAAGNGSGCIGVGKVRRQLEAHAGRRLLARVPGLRMPGQRFVRARMAGLHERIEAKLRMRREAQRQPFAVLVGGPGKAERDVVLPAQAVQRGDEGAEQSV
jgi:hypothetical protein